MLKNIEAILTAAGYSWKNVVKCTCLLKNINELRNMNEEYGAFFEDDPPARTAYEVACLPLGAGIEIEAIAMK